MPASLLVEHGMRIGSCERRPDRYDVDDLDGVPDRVNTFASGAPAEA